MSRVPPVEEQCDKTARPQRRSPFSIATTAGVSLRLNAFTSDHYVTWLETKLAAVGVVKLIPDDETLTAASLSAIYLHAMNAELARKFHETARR